ncbi:uncharacterized protein LOC108678764 [Hyalella azteca]|uniref:Uncharacterized protein LOC108678764 n=1 Tax=Hyalella azteca TaxID=294128 RepID=A0A8B7PBX1_HYAAZ|nr:uncharacterized protein LOC108678764 [Hyalella azteca]
MRYNRKRYNRMHNSRKRYNRKHYNRMRYNRMRYNRKRYNRQLFATSFSSAEQKEDEFNNGKLTSGQVFGDNKYHHILVEPKSGEKKTAGLSADRRGGNHRFADRDELTKNQYAWFTSSRGSGCYRLVRPRMRIARQFIQATVVTPDRAECEYECAKAKEFTCRGFNFRCAFTCRGFNFRYRTRDNRSTAPNCELSLQDTYGADLDDERVFHVDHDFDFYERTKLGRDCEGSLFGLGNSPGGQETFKRPGNPSATSGRLPFGFGASSGTGDRFGTSVVSGGDSRLGDRLRPGSGGFSSGFGLGGLGSSGTSNTLPTQSFGLFREDCYRLARANTRLGLRVVRDQLRATDVNDCKLRCHQSRHFMCRSFAFNYRSAARREENCFLSAREVTQISAFDLPIDSGYDVFQRRIYDRECDGGFSDSAFLTSEGGTETVSGLRCYGRNRCTEDKLGGYWYCETNAVGAWDYCCRPDQVCSAGDNEAFKWCYVGSVGVEQWRPCTGSSFRRDFLHESPSNTTLIELLDSQGDFNDSNHTVKDSDRLAHGKDSDQFEVERPRSPDPAKFQGDSLLPNSFQPLKAVNFSLDKSKLYVEGEELHLTDEEKRGAFSDGGQGDQEGRSEAAIELHDLPNLG